MCDPVSYAGKTCATCADARAKVSEGNCGECLSIEMETQKPFTKWQPKEKA